MQYPNNYMHRERTFIQKCKPRGAAIRSLFFHWFPWGSMQLYCLALGLFFVFFLSVAVRPQESCCYYRSGSWPSLPPTHTLPIGEPHTQVIISQGLQLYKIRVPVCNIPFPHLQSRSTSSYKYARTEARDAFGCNFKTVLHVNSTRSPGSRHNT